MYTVPSRPIAGTTLRPARWAPHGRVGGTAVGDGGKGPSVDGNGTSQGSVAAGAPGVSVAKSASVAVSFGDTWTSQARADPKSSGSMYTTL